MLAQVFSCEFSENSKNTFFTEHLRTTASAFSFSESATGGVLWKKVFLQILQNSQKNTCGLLNFQEQLFFRAPFLNFLSLDDCFWFSPATLLRWVTANSVWKTSDEYSLSRNTNLSRQHKFSVYAFIGLHCLLPEAATRVEMFCKKGVLKNFVNFIGKHLSWSLFLINCRPETYFEEHLSTTAFHYTHTTSLLFISFTLYSAPSSSALLLLLISPMFVFGSKSESFKEFKSGVSFSVLGKFFPGKFPPITLLLESSTQIPPPQVKFPPGIFPLISLIVFLQLTLRFDSDRGERGQFAWENSVCAIVTNTKLSTKKCSWFPRRVLLFLLLLLYYTIIQIS